ncbi:N-alpha-acetyltransferase 15, NatA auxiliary subunit [Cichlidogyrus casuarinus]|uniref:N-alpha-acetyltransferase 15, NatA auxiliary subunit n=1 Tax=Cichlidogyrus casuarinus TaxID=1844966 RepID=A0ABD2QA14_9PLAT
MLKAVKQGLGQKNAKDHPWLHQCAVRLLLKMQQLRSQISSQESPLQDASGSAEQHAMAWELAEAEFSKLFPDSERNPDKYNDIFQARNSGSLLAQMHVQIAKIFINPSEKTRLISSMPLPGSEKWTSLTCNEAMEAQNVLKRCQDAAQVGRISEDFLERFRKEAANRFPQATVFIPLAEKEQLCAKVAREAAEAKKRNNASSFLGLYADTESVDKLCGAVAEMELADSSEQAIPDQNMANGVAPTNHKSTKKSNKGK